MPTKPWQTSLLVLLSLILLAYQGPYLWYVEYRDVEDALDNPVDAELTQQYVIRTAKEYNPVCFRKISATIADWEQTRALIPVGHLKSDDHLLTCVVTWSPGTSFKEIQALPDLSGLLYHPGITEQKSIPELGDDYPVAILRVGKMEQLRKFYASRRRTRLIVSVPVGIFAALGIVQLLTFVGGIRQLLRHPLLLTGMWVIIGLIPLSLWLFEMLPITAPAWTYSGLPSGATVSQERLGRTLFCILLIVVSVFPWIWLDSLRIGGLHVFKSLLRALRLQLNAKRIRLTALVMLSSVAVTAWFCITAPKLPNPYFVHINLTILAGAFLAAFRPPIAIALMPSLSESADYLHVVSKSLIPFRTVALVDGGRVGSVPSFGKDDNLRTSAHIDWRAMVRRLMDSVPIIAVDARIPSDVVSEEIDWILESARRRDRTVMIVLDNRQSPIPSTP